MDEELTEHLKCPICLEIPLNEVYQCKDGHTICSSCFTNVTTCPQCREPFGAQKIRSRVVESLLDSFKFDCHNVELGCKEVLKRKELAAHMTTCVYSQRTIQLCRQIGYYYCSFAVNTLNFDSAFKHFQNEHDFILREGSVLNIHLENFTDTASTSSGQDSMWTPIILKLDETVTFLVLSTVNADDQSLTLLCLFLGDPITNQDAEFEAEFKIKSGSDEVPDLTWKVTPVGIKHASVILSLTPFKIPLKLLREYYTAGDNLSVKLVVAEKPKPGTDLPPPNEEVEPTCTFNVPIRRTELPSRLQPEDEVIECQQARRPNSSYYPWSSVNANNDVDPAFLPPPIYPSRPVRVFPPPHPSSTLLNSNYERATTPPPLPPTYTETFTNRIRHLVFPPPQPSPRTQLDTSPRRHNRRLRFNSFAPPQPSSSRFQ